MILPAGVLNKLVDQSVYCIWAYYTSDITLREFLREKYRCRKVGARYDDATLEESVIHFDPRKYGLRDYLSKKGITRGEFVYHIKTCLGLN